MTNEKLIFATTARMLVLEFLDDLINLKIEFKKFFKNLIAQLMRHAPIYL